MTAIFGRHGDLQRPGDHLGDAPSLETSIMPQKFDWNAPPPTLPDKDGHYPVAMPGVTSGDEIWARINRELAEKAGRQSQAGQPPAGLSRGESSAYGTRPAPDRRASRLSGCASGMD